MIASLAEPAMIMIVFTLALIAGSTQLSTIAEFMASPQSGCAFRWRWRSSRSIMVAIAENGRIPVDNPATHLELTMVHEAMVLEYSGRHLALIELSSSLKLLLYVSLHRLPVRALGHGAGRRRHCRRSPSGSPPMSGSSPSLGFLLALFETSIAKMRVFRVPEFLGVALMLGLLATLLRFVSGSF